MAEGYAVIIPTDLTKQIQTKTQYLDDPLPYRIIELVR